MTIREIAEILHRDECHRNGVEPVGFMLLPQFALERGADTESRRSYHRQKYEAVLHSVEAFIA